MSDLALIEAYYRKCMRNLSALIPEGVYFVDLEFLHHFDLLHFQPGEGRELVLPHSFRVVESVDKLTFINDEFVVWIVSHQANQIPATYILIALNAPDRAPRLEVAIIASGVYNASNLALKVLDRFLTDIRETETELSGY